MIITCSDVKLALSILLLDRSALRLISPGYNLSKGFLLYGPPGTGKTMLVEVGKH